MTASSLLAFDAADLHPRLEAATDAELDLLEYGVIGLDADHVVRRYSERESAMARLPVDTVKGQPFFTMVAACMNNFLVAERFVDAAAQGSTLDATIDYVLTFRMRPTKVKLRLLASPSCTLRYILVNRLS